MSHGRRKVCNKFRIQWFYFFSSFSFLSFRLLLFCLFLFAFLSFNSFFALFSFLFLIFCLYHKKRWKQKSIISFIRNKFKKTNHILFHFCSDQVSVFIKKFIFLILLPLPFPPRTAGLNFCCYDAQRQGCTTFARKTLIALLL